MGQIGSSQAAQGVRLRKNVESEKEASDAILRNPKCHQLTDFLGNSVVVCVVTASSAVACSKRMLHVIPLGSETDDDTNLYSPP